MEEGGVGRANTGSYIVLLLLRPALADGSRVIVLSVMGAF